MRTNGICTTRNLSWRMRLTNSSRILRYKRISYSQPDDMIIRKMWTCRVVHFLVPADHRVKLEKKEKNEKKDKYLDLAREFLKNWNMNLTALPIVFGALGTVTKELIKGLEELEIRGRVETLQTTTLSRSERILIRVLESWKDVLSLKL